MAAPTFFLRLGSLRDGHRAARLRGRDQNLDACRDFAHRAEGRKRDFSGRADGTGQDHRPLPAQGSATPGPGHRRYQARSRRAEAGVRVGQTLGASRGSRGGSTARAVASTLCHDHCGSCGAGGRRSGPGLVAAEAACFRPGASEWVQITNLPDSAVQPALSSDGRMLTFIRGPSSFITSGQVYVKMLPSGEPVQLTRDNRTKMSPVFSPDGSRIAYTVPRLGHLGRASLGRRTAPVAPERFGPGVDRQIEAAVF